MGAENTKKAWKVEIDTETCSLCEMCVNRCSNHALISRRRDDVLEILFDPHLCDACLGQTFCQEHCPEDSVSVSLVPVDEFPQTPVSLIEGQLATCRDCGQQFMPQRKLSTLLEQQKITPKEVHKLCPACRRNQLMDSYLKITGQI